VSSETDEKWNSCNILALIFESFTKEIRESQRWRDIFSKSRIDTNFYVNFNTMIFYPKILDKRQGE